MEKRQEARRHALDALRIAPEASLLLAPLDYIFADHLRQRMLCKLLDEMAAEPECDGEAAAAAVDFLTGDFGTHIVDEEQDLFPLLRRRAEPDDGIDRVLGELSDEHRADAIDAEAIVALFSEVAAETGRRPIEAASRDLLRRFSKSERRHLVCENAIVLPLARLRLTRDDLRNLGRRMAARRGLDYPEAANAH